MKRARLSNEQVRMVTDAAKEIVARTPNASPGLVMLAAQKAVLLPEQHMAESTTKSPARWDRRLRDAFVEHGILGPTFASVGKRVAAKEGPPPVLEPLALKPVTLDGATLEQLLSRVFDLQYLRLQADMHAYVNDLLRAGMQVTAVPEHVADALAASVHIVRASLPRVLAVGLLPAQAHILRKSCESNAIQCELRFFKDESNKQLRQHARWADHVFVMVGFCSHETQNIARKVNDNIHLIPGSVSDLVRVLRSTIS